MGRVQKLVIRLVLSVVFAFLVTRLFFQNIPMIKVLGLALVLFCLAYVFEFLNVVRVYSKPPGKRVDKKDPFVLPSGSTVLDLAQAVHRDLPEQLRFARIWGANTYAGQTVHRNHVLSDGDVLELHT